ncbi:MAG: VOC family protein [Candidatus Eisenbacteria bacterium]|nr:VOC family protein [Candidatus Eisenbacteria bacterium]
MARNPVIWWEINAKDGERLTEFYREVFEWDCPLDEGSGIWEVDSTGGRSGAISGGIFTGKGRLPYHRCLYVEVEDIEEMTRRVVANGLPILQGPFEVGGGTQLAFFQDPEGHMIGLLQRAKDGE